MSRARDLYDYLMKNGEDGINEIIDKNDPWTEHLFVDYKRSKRQTEVGPVNPDDRDNLAKAISGFGNSSGGLIVWGVKCKKGTAGVDIPSKANPLKEVIKFRSQLEGLISGLTIPAHDGVENETIVVNDDGDGYLLTYIPKNDYAPLRSLKHDQYYWRSGSSFQSVSHDALAGMFGKRPTPKLTLVGKPAPPKYENQNTVRLERVFCIRNDGVSMIRGVFFTFQMEQIIGPTCELRFDPYMSGILQQHGTPKNIISLTSDDDYKLAPGTSRDFFLMKIYLRYPIETGLKVKVHYGCEDSPVHSFEFAKDKAFLHGVFEFCLGGWDSRLKHSWQYHTDVHQQGLEEANRDAFDTTIDIPMLV